MRPRVLSISPYAAADVDLVVTSEQPSSLVPLTLTTDPFVFDVPRTLLLTFADGPVDAAIAEDDAVFTDQTTEANEGTADDMDLLPAVPVLIEDKYYFGAQNPFGRLDLDVSTAKDARRKILDGECDLIVKVEALIAVEKMEEGQRL